MTSIKVHRYVGEVERLEGVCNTLAVAIGGGLARGEVAVGDEVGKGVGLDDQRDGDLGVLFDDSNNGWGGQYVFKAFLMKY